MIPGLVSVIVPVYNMEKTVRKCLDSILSQTYNLVEIVVINDGSTDNSEKIILQLKRNNSSIRYITRENMGLSFTYKEGIDLSNGEYIIFVDSDDYIDKEMIELLIGEQKKYGGDIVQSGIVFENTVGKIISRFVTNNRIYNDKKEVFIDYFLTNRINKTFAGTLFLRRLFDDVSFKTGALSIDLQVMPFVLQNSLCFVQSNHCFYHAVMYMNSVSRRSITESMYNDKIYTKNILESFFEEYHPELNDIMYFRNAMLAATSYAKIVDNKNNLTEVDIKIDFCKKLFDKNYILFLNSWAKEKVSKKDMVKLKLFKISPRLLQICLKLYAYKKMN